MLKVIAKRWLRHLNFWATLRSTQVLCTWGRACETSPLVSALHLGTNVGPDDMYTLSGRRTAYPQVVVAARYKAEPCQKGDPHVLATDHRPQPCSLPENLQACKLVSFHRACPERVISKILTLMASVHPYKAALPLPSSSPSPPILEPSSDQTQPYQIIIRTPPRRRHEQPHILISSFALNKFKLVPHHHHRPLQPASILEPD